MSAGLTRTCPYTDKCYEPQNLAAISLVGDTAVPYINTKQHSDDRYPRENALAQTTPKYNKLKIMTVSISSNQSCHACSCTYHLVTWPRSAVRLPLAIASCAHFPRVNCQAEGVQLSDSARLWWEVCKRLWLAEHGMEYRPGPGRSGVGNTISADMKAPWRVAGSPLLHLPGLSLDHDYYLHGCNCAGVIVLLLHITYHELHARHRPGTLQVESLQFELNLGQWSLANSHNLMRVSWVFVLGHGVAAAQEAVPEKGE